MGHWEPQGKLQLSLQVARQKREEGLAHCNSRETDNNCNGTLHTSPITGRKNIDHRNDAYSRGPQSYEHDYHKGFNVFAVHNQGLSHLLQIDSLERQTKPEVDTVDTVDSRFLYRPHNSQPEKSVSWGMSEVSPAEDQIPAYRDVSSTVKKQSQHVTGNANINQYPPSYQQPTESEEMVREMHELENKMMKVTSENKKLQEEKRKLEQQVEKLNVQIRNIKNTEKQPPSNAVEFSGKAITEIGILRGQVETLEMEIKRLNRKSEDLLKEKTEVKQEQDRLQRRLSEEQKKVEERDLKLQEIKHKSAILEGESRKKDKAIQDVTNRLKEEQTRSTKLTTEMNVKENRIDQLESDLRASDQAVKDRTHKLSEEQRRVQEQEKELKENKRKSATLEGESRKKDRTIEDLTKRLSDEMGTKVAADESSLENVNIKDRPMNIASEYELLCSDQWLQAKTDLDELTPSAGEDTKMTFLCDILITCLAESDKLKKAMLGDVGRILNKPGVQTQGDSIPSSTETVSLPDKLMQNLMDLERQTVETTDLSLLHESVRNVVTTKANSTFNKPELTTSKGVDRYLKASAVTTWKMMLQRPPMSFRQDGIGGKWEGEKKQDVFWSSSDPEDQRSRVKYYVHPALYHGEAMMVKGRVFLSTE